MDGPRPAPTRAGAPAIVDRLTYHGNIQAVMEPDGFPLWVADVEPGSVHDLTVARKHVLGSLYWAASQLELPTLSDGDYEGAGIGVHTPHKQPAGDQILDVHNRTYNALPHRLRRLGERGSALLTGPSKPPSFSPISNTTDSPEVAEITSLAYNPCLECKLCVSACPVGAIGKDGSFDLGACYTHNYREFMTGFTDLLQTVADSADAADFRSRVSDTEALSWWQSLAYKPNYKAAYCMAVCPAGEDVIGPYLDNRNEFRDRVVAPLRDKVEPVYVQPGSPAEHYTGSRFPHKHIRHVDNGIRRPAPKESTVDQ